MTEEDAICKSWRRVGPGQWQQVDDPRNAEDYDTWDFGMEPIPNDTTWIRSKSTQNVSNYSTSSR